MDEQFAADTVVATETIDDPVVESTSSEYLGRWNQLVSTTNWEKGRIICEWREALLAAGAPAGKLHRRSLEPPRGQRHPATRRPAAPRLSAVWRDPRSSIRGLFWSHFQIALDWSDAECGWKAPCRTIGRFPRCGRSGAARSASCRHRQASRSLPTKWTKTPLPSEVGRDRPFPRRSARSTTRPTTSSRTATTR